MASSGDVDDAKLDRVAVDGTGRRGLGGRRMLVRLAQAWEAGDLATLERDGQWGGCVASDDDRQAMRRLNDERIGRRR